MEKQFSWLLLVAGCCTLILSGCSWLEDWPPGERTAQAPFPEDVAVMQVEGGTWLSPDIGRVGVVGGNAAISPDVAARLNALETEVAILRNDMSMMAPALTRLAEMQRDISEILATMQPSNVSQSNFQSSQTREQLAAVYETASQPQPLTPFQQAAAASEPVSANPAPVPVETRATGSIKAIRLGEHDEKTRIVLDATGEIPFQVNLDNSSRQLVVDLPGVSWQAAQAGAVGGNSVVAGFEAVPTSNGTQLALRLDRASQVLWTQALPGNGDKSPRIVIDLQK